jgi:hypothetical protein
MGHGGVAPLTPNLVTHGGGYQYVSNTSLHNTDTVSALTLQDALTTPWCSSNKLVCGCCEPVGRAACADSCFSLVQFWISGYLSTVLPATADFTWAWSATCCGTLPVMAGFTVLMCKLNFPVVVWLARIFGITDTRAYVPWEVPYDFRPSV